MNVLGLQGRIIVQYLGSGHARGQQVEDKINGIPLVAYGRLPVAYIGIQGDAIGQVVHPIRIRETDKVNQQDEEEAIAASRYFSPTKC